MASHQRINVCIIAIGLTRNILRNQEEHRCASLLRPLATLFHPLQEFHNVSSRFSCQVQKALSLGGIRRIPLLFLPCTILMPFLSFFFQPRQRFLTFLQFLIFQGLSSTFCTLSSHCQCFDHSFLFASQRSSNPRVFLLFLPNMHSSSPHCWLRYFVEKSSTALCTLDHLLHLSLMHLLHLFFLISSSCPPAIRIICAWYFPILDESTLSHSLPPATPRPTIGFQHQSSFLRRFSLSDLS